MTLYLDLIWLLNLGIDYLLLWMTALFRKSTFSHWRVICAAVLGASYVLFLFIPPLDMFYTFSVKVLISIVIVLIAFGYSTFRSFVALFSTFYFISFLTGGGMLAIHYLLASKNELAVRMADVQSSGYGDAVSWWFVLIGFPVMLWFSHSRWKRIEQVRVRDNHSLHVQIRFRDCWVTCAGLLDTGNQLRDPWSKAPVMLVEAKVLQPVLPSAWGQVVQDPQQIDKLMNDNVPDEWLSRLKLIPYRGVKQQLDMMMAVRCDEALFQQEGKQWRQTGVYVGVAADVLSVSGDFQAIVHPELVRDQNMVIDAEKEEAM